MGNEACSLLRGMNGRAKLNMTDSLVLLLSTDWFLPYWTEIGIEIAEEKKVGIQQGCRKIVDELLDGAESLYLVSFSEERKQVTESKFLTLLRKWEAEPEVSATFREWENLSHGELSAVVQCAMLNAEVPSADGSGNVPCLEFAIRAEVVKAWEAHSLKASVFRDICLSSKTTWDLRTQKLLSSPRTLVNELWRVLLDHRFRTFWADLQKRLSSQQLQELVSWYRAMVKAKAHEDRPDLIPSYIS
jgi:hypothetical protein